MNAAENNTLRARAERAVGDLVLAELFVVQATLESAAALGESWNGLRNQLSGDETPEEDFSSFLQRTRRQLTEPYATRFRYLRELNRDTDA
jgi:DNA-binding SARP family transcriptional activator